MAKKKAKKVVSKKNKFAGKKIAIIYRPKTSEALDRAQELSTWLREQSIQVYHQPHRRIDKHSKGLSKESLIDDLDLVIVLGGDGTYLRAARMLHGRKTPILGVNMGSLGFLTNTRQKDLFRAVLATLEGKMVLRPRSMFSVTVKNKKETNEYLSLNDVVIERGDLSQLIEIQIGFENTYVTDIKADGIVISTPTGSTAYNLAAGGPILHPEVSAFALTAISPHSLTSRPLVFPDDRSLSLKLIRKCHMGRLTLDGRLAQKISPDDEIIITKHSKAHYVVRHPTHEYFDLLREKLKFGQRA